MKILVIGAGGREHAIVWAIQKTSSEISKVFCTPGNAGIAQDARTLPLQADDHASLIAFAESEKIDLTFVGPEAPLVAGIVDAFDQKGLPIVGPTSAAARLEGSKVFAKDFMRRHRIPTAAYRASQTVDEAKLALRSGEFGEADSRVVIKADGLAAGKGVVVATSRADAEVALEDLMVKHVAGKSAASQVIIEEALVGKEVSLLLFSDGNNYALMPPARDHKRIGENDTGPNTGGMGSITDDSILDSATLSRVVQEIVEPTLEGARSEGFAFKGVLFLGLMLTDAGPKLLEYNVRFGDPETQAILVRLETDLVAIFDSMRRGTIDQRQIKWRSGASACVILANRGYPGKYETGAVIEGLTAAEAGAVKVFHAGTTISSDGVVRAAGGRVLGVTAAADNLDRALDSCYGAIRKISWDGMQFRRDIGRSAVA